MPSNAPRPTLPQTQSQHVPSSLPQSVPATAPTSAQNLGQAPRVKAEPGSNGQPGLPSMANPGPAHTLNAQSARDRAVNFVQQRYGAMATNSITQMQAHQGGLAMPGQPHAQSHAHANGQMPTIKTEGYPASSQPSLGQTDGADDGLADWKAEVARRREAAERQGRRGDRMLRDHLKQQMLELEAGGLLRPLDEHETRSRRVMAVTERANSASEPGSAVPNLPAPFDGTDDGVKEEADEDAINSDLDDPDDLAAEDHDVDESEGQVMLCTYDKVQRVKNKWKCTLKDGILTTGGKE